MTEKPSYEELKNRVRDLERKKETSAHEYEQLYVLWSNSQKRLQNILGAIPFIIVMLDADGNIVFCNDVLFNLTGWKPEEIVGKNWFDTCLPADIRSRVRVSVFNKILDKQEFPKEYLNEILIHTGEQRLIRWNNSVFYDARGRIETVISVGEDLTEKNRFIEALVKSEERFRLIAENSIDDIWQLDMEGNVTYTSPAKTRIFGYSDEESQQMAFEDFIAGDELDEVVAAGMSAITEKKSRLIETIGIKKDGSTIPIEIAVSPMIKEGELVGAQGVVRDITKRKKTEIKLKDSEERYRMIAENTSDFIWILDLETLHLSYVSPSVKNILGYTADEHMNRPLDDILLPDMFTQAMETLSEALSRDESGTGDERITKRLEWQEYHKDGHLIWVEAEMSLIRDKEGRAVSVIGITRDITKRKKAEEDLIKRNEFIETILDSLPIGLAVNKMSDGNITYVNRKFQEIYGWPVEAVPNVDEFFQKVYPGQETLKERVLTDILSGEPERMKWNDLTATAMNGQQRIVTAINIPLPDQDLMISTVQDETQRYAAIRELKEAEAERLSLESHLRQAQKMDSLGTLAGGIAHDFNNILFPVIGFAEMMLLDADKNHRHRDYLNRILEAAKRGSNLTRQILAFSRRSEKEIKPMDIKAVVLEVLKLIRPTLPTTIRITHSMDSHCGLVMGDATQIHQVIMNLITNAYHAMQDRGGLLDIMLNKKEFTVNERHPPSVKPGSYVCLTVLDTGVGMDNAIMERIFDPYFTTKEKHRGTGLGLAMVHSIVKGHDGHIRVRSEPGKGTSFQVYLPMLDQVSPETRSEIIYELQKGDEHILVVDDEENVVIIEQTILEKLGYRVTTKTGSREALDLFKENPYTFDLVISDMTMPHMTGFQLARELLALRNDVPIIICTGFSDTVDEKKTKDIGVKAFLMKPIDVKTLSDSVRAVLDDH